MIDQKTNRSNKLRLYCNTCNHHHGETAYLCFHPDYIGRDGDGVSLTAMEQEFVKRMGCANHSQAKEWLMRDARLELEAMVDSEHLQWELTKFLANHREPLVIK